MAKVDLEIKRHNDMAKHKEKEGICAICGNRAVVTRDHVPPQSIFLKPLPSNMITVPACEPCNNGAKLDDEYLQGLRRHGRSSWDEAGGALEGKVRGFYSREKSGLKDSNSSRPARLIEFHRQIPLQTFDGRILPDELVGFVLPFDADRINRVLVKIVRGLYYHHYHAVMPRSTHFIVSQIPLDELRLRHVLVNCKGLIGNHEEFLYWFDLSGQHMEWALIFFVYHIFTLETMPSKSGDEEISIRELM